MYQPSLEKRPISNDEINVGQNERILSLFGGAALTMFALLRRGVISLPTLLTGLTLLYRGFTGYSRFYHMSGINTAVKTNRTAVSVPHKQGVHVVRSVTINRPIEELYAFWHDPTNLPQVMTYIESVEPRGENRAHWTLKLPGGGTTEFDAEIFTDVPNEVISWRSLPGADIANAGSVRFRRAPGDRGTEVQLTLEFVPPAGPLGQAIFSLFGEAPAQYIGQFLREFKQMMETGEKATTKKQTSGRIHEVER